MMRREFIATTLGAGVAAGLTRSGADAAPSRSGAERRFKLRYAPHFGMFQHHAGDDPVDQLQFMADEGFTAFEDNWMVRRSPTTGEINFRNVFAHLHAKGHQGIVGMEHGNSRPGKDGERAVIDAYAACDSY